MAAPMRSSDFRSIVEPILNQAFDGVYDQRADEYKQVFTESNGIARAYHEEPMLYGMSSAPLMPDSNPVTYDAGGQLFVKRYTYDVYGLAFALTKVLVEDGDRYFLVAVALAADTTNAELRVLGVPGVDRQVALVALGMPETIGHRAQLQPFGLDRLGPLPLAQEQDVGLHLGGGDTGEGALGEPNGTQEVRLTCDVLAYRVVLGVHRVAAGDEAH